MNITQKSIRSSVYNTGATIIRTAILFVRSIILTRLLTPGIFGEYVLITSILTLSQIIPEFGLEGALLYNTEEEELESASETQFTLTILFSLVWMIVIVILVSFIVPREDQWIYYIVTVLLFFNQFTGTPRTILVKKLEFKRIASLSVITAFVTSIAAIFLAWNGFGIWSFLIPRGIGIIIELFGFYVVTPVWKPTFGWNVSTAKNLLNFGKKILQGNILFQALDRVDDIWTGIVLGKTPLGFYNRAYKFANYPRNIIAAPIGSVANSTYAQLNGDRTRLSKAFFRVNALLIRVNFLFAGLLALVAPEFIRIIIGAQWMPMLDAFRLMIVYTLLDPIKGNIAGVINASGAPEKVVRARFIQLLILIVGLLLLTSGYQVEGVAFAVNVMLIAGIAILFFEARNYVDFSIGKMFGVPVLCLVVGMFISRLAIQIPGILGSDWRTGGVKTAIYCILYLGGVLLFERQHLNMVFSMISTLMPGKFHKFLNLVSPVEE